MTKIVFRTLYVFAWFLAILGEIIIYRGQNRLLYGPDSWGYFAQGNIVVLGNWLLLVGASVVFCHTVAITGKHSALWQWILYMAIAGSALFIAGDCFVRFQGWDIFPASLVHHLFFVLLVVLAFGWRQIYVKWWTYPAD